MNVRIIANPIAGGGRGRTLAGELHQALRSRGAATELRITEKKGDATRFAAEDGADTIVSVGGDGTAHEIVNGLIGKRTRLGILGVGTANVVARQFKLPKKPGPVADLVMAGKTTEMDLGLRNGERFLLGAGAGLDAAIVARVESGRKGSSSLLRWVIPSIQTILTYTYPKIRAIVDGEVVSETAEYAIVGNCVMSAAVFPATPHAHTDDGLLDLCLVHDITAWKCASLAVAVFSPRFTQRKDIVYRQGKSIRLEPAAESAAPLQVDGDPAGCVPCDFGVEPAALNLLVP